MFEEEQVPHSNALHCRVRGRGSYLAGPRARFNLNLDRLSPSARQAAEEAGIGSGCRNPFQSIVVRAVEILYACDEAVRLIDAYEPPDPPAIEPQTRAAVGHGVTEAPRGLLYHRYELGDDGRSGRPGSCRQPQNQRTIEEDLHEFVQRNLELDDDELTLRCEQTIAATIPASPAQHFLRLEVDRV
jgi:coenzyme F420-reducing hydrogenase alpha subunit